MPAERVAPLYLITPEWNAASYDAAGPARAAASDASDTVRAPRWNAVGDAHGGSDIGAAAFAPFLERLEHALRTGIDLVQLRVKSLDAIRYRALARAAREVCDRQQATLILNGPASSVVGAADSGFANPVDEANANGIHLSSARLMACLRRPVAQSCIVSAACHTLAELQQAARIGADFVTLSPVLPTRSHPDAAPLGWERFAELVAASSVPVYALGGMTRAHLARAQTCGARGIAAISGLW